MPILEGLASTIATTMQFDNMNGHPYRALDVSCQEIRVLDVEPGNHISLSRQ